MPTPDADRCPACGASNQCSQVANPEASSCWCYGVSIDPERLKALPPEQLNRRCLCPRCAGVLDQLQRQQHAP